MTEAYWQVCGIPGVMLEFLHGKVSDRKLRHFIVACARRLLPDGADFDVIEALAVAERYADGAASGRALARARRSLNEEHASRVRRWPQLYTDYVQSVPAWYATRDEFTSSASRAAWSYAFSNTRMPSGTIADAQRELTRQAGMLRDIFGNPFKTATLNPAWNTGNVTGLAQSIYAERAFERLPILADALEDAGCDKADILNHCRRPAEHVRGCWVVDLVLGKS